MQLFQAANFATLYCEKNNLSPDRFLAAVFKEVVYPHVRVFGLSLLFPDAFAVDRDFLRQVGQVHNMAEYVEIENSYRRLITHFPSFRRNLYMRVSSRRIRQLVAEYLRKNDARQYSTVE